MFEFIRPRTENSNHPEWTNENIIGINKFKKKNIIKQKEINKEEKEEEFVKEQEEN